MLRASFFGLIAWAGLIGASAGADKTTPAKPSGAGRAIQVPGYKTQTIEGFTVLISSETLKNADNSSYERKPLEVLALELKTLTGLMPERTLKVLRTVPIWVEWDEQLKMSNGRDGVALAVYYGGHQKGLLAEGKNPLKAKCVTILRMKALTEEHQPKRDSGRCVILHEIAHAVHFELLGRDNAGIKAAYKHAMANKLYDPKMYVSTNEAEFFAELTCAYFNQLHHYPHKRADLKKHDPLTYKMMEGVWGKQKEVAGKKPAAGTAPDLNLRLTEIDLGKPVLGPKVAAGDLKGRAVLVVLWNAGSSSSLACFPKLAAWDGELSPFGLATVAVHLTGSKTVDVAAVARSRGVPFAVTEGKWLKGGQVAEFKDFPLGLVFDHEGQCVYRGSPFDADTAARAAVGNSLVAAAGVEEPGKALTPVVEMMQKGKPLSSALSRLASLARSTDEETVREAKLLLDKMTEAGRRVLDEAEPLVMDDPVGAYLKVERLPAIFKETPVATRANQLLSKLKQNKAVATELKARTSLNTVKKYDTELGSRPGSFDPTLEKFRRDNAALLRQLDAAVRQMKKTWPDTKATEEAVRIGEKYGLAVR
jgi:hypothetical protein